MSKLCLSILSASQLFSLLQFHVTHWQINATMRPRYNTETGGIQMSEFVPWKRCKGCRQWSVTIADCTSFLRPLCVRFNTFNGRVEPLGRNVSFSLLKSTWEGWCCKAEKSAINPKRRIESKSRLGGFMGRCGTLATHSVGAAALHGAKWHKHHPCKHTHTVGLMCCKRLFFL